jgi:hypothetical protein
MTVDELTALIAQKHNITDPIKLRRITDVLEHLDDDHDGVLNVDLSLDVRIL